MKYPNYLVHWKYIRKYKKNGKWRYVYANKDIHSSIEYGMNQQIQQRARMKDNLNDYDRYKRLLNDIYKRAGKGSTTDVYEHARDEAVEKFKSNSKNYSRSSKYVESLISAHELTPLSKIFNKKK